MPWHSSTHHYITTLLFLAVNQHDALGSSLQHHGARLMGIDKDLPAHIITSLHYYCTGVSEALTCTLSCFIACNTLSGLALRLGIATSANRSPYMYSYVTQWHTFLSVPALFGSIGNNSQCTKLTEKTKKNS